MFHVKVHLFHVKVQCYISNREIIILETSCEARYRAGGGEGNLVFVQIIYPSAKAFSETLKLFSSGVKQEKVKRYAHSFI